MVEFDDQTNPKILAIVSKIFISTIIDTQNHYLPKIN